MRKQLSTAAALIILIPAAAAALILLQPSLLRIPLVMLLSQSTGLEWRIDGDFQAEVGLTSHLIAERLTLDNPAWKDHPRVADLSRLEASIDLVALIRGEIRIPLLTAADGDLHLARDRNGRGNWQGHKTAKKSESGGNLKIAEIGQLSLLDIRARYGQPGMAPLTFALLNAKLALGANEGIQASASMQLDGQPLTLTASSDLDSIQANDGEAFPFHASLRSEDAELEVTGVMGWPFRSAATRLKIGLKGEKLSRLASALSGVTIPPLGSFQMQASLQGNQEKLELDLESASLEESRLSGKLFISSNQPRPLLTADLRIDRLPRALTDWLEQPYKGQQEPAGDQGDSGWSVLREVDAEQIGLEIGQLKLKGQELGRIRLDGRLEKARLDLRLHPTRAFSEHLEGTLWLDASTGKPAFGLDARSEALDLGSLLGFFGKPAGISGLVGDLRLEVAGSLQAPVLPGIHTLNLEASGVRLNTGADGHAPLSVEAKEIHATLNPKTETLDFRLGGTIEEWPLQVGLQVGNLASPSANTRYPLKLEVMAANTRLTAEGSASYPASGLVYDLNLDLKADDLSELARLTGHNLSEVAPLRADITIKGGSEGLQWKSDGIQLGVTHIRGEGQVGWSGKSVEYRLTAEMESEHGRLISSLLLPDLPEIGPVRVSAQLFGNGHSLELKVPAFRVAETSASGTATIEFDGKRPRVVADIAADRLQLADFFAPAAQPEEGNADATDRVIPDFRVDAEPLRHLDLRASTVISEVLYGKRNLGNYTISTSIREGRLTADSRFSSAYLSESRYQGELYQENGKSRASMKLNAKDLDYGGLLDALGISNRVDGKLDLDIHFRGSGNRFPGLLASADGGLSVSGGPGAFDDKTMRLWGGSLFDLVMPTAITGQKAVRVNCLAARYRLSGGVFSSEGIVVDTDATTIGGAVRVELPSEKLQGAFQPRPKRLRLVTLDPPISLGGTLANPRIEPLAGDTLLALGKLAAGLVNPAYLLILSGSLGTGLENPCQKVLEGNRLEQQAGSGNIFTKVIDELKSGYEESSEADAPPQGEERETRR